MMKTRLHIDIGAIIAIFGAGLAAYAWQGSWALALMVTCCVMAVYQPTRTS